MEKFVSPINARMVAAFQELRFLEGDEIGQILAPRLNNVRVSEYELNLPIDQLVTDGRITVDDLATFLTTSANEAKMIYITNEVFISGAGLLEIHPYARLHRCTCDYEVRYRSRSNGLQLRQLCCLYAPSAQQASTTLEALVALLVASSSSAVTFASLGPHFQGGNRTLLDLPSDTFARLIELPRTQVSFYNLCLAEEACTALVETHQDLQLMMMKCEFGDEGAAFIQSVTENSGVSCFKAHDNNPFSPANFRSFLIGLSNNTRLKTLSLDGFLLTEDNWLGLSAALSENSGLEKLTLGCKGISDENFVGLMESLSEHKSLHFLQLRQVLPEEENRDETDGPNELQSQLKLKRTQGVVSLVKKNKTITRIEMNEHDEDLWSSEVVPRLKINGHRPMVLAIGAASEEIKLDMLLECLGNNKDDLDLIFLYVLEHGGLLAEAVTDAPFPVSSGESSA